MQGPLPNSLPTLLHYAFPSRVWIWTRWRALVQGCQTGQFRICSLALEGGSPSRTLLTAWTCTSWMASLSSQCLVEKGSTGEQPQGQNISYIPFRYADWDIYMENDKFSGISFKILQGGGKGGNYKTVQYASEGSMSTYYTSFPLVPPRIFFLRLWKGGRKRKRNINAWLPLTHLPLETWPAIQTCALTGNQTCNHLVHRPALNPLESHQPGVTPARAL